MEKTMDKIIALAKARGFVYPGSEIYGGLANTWDYGNLGVELKNNVKRAWWQKFIQESPYNVGVDLSLIHISTAPHRSRYRELYFLRSLWESMTSESCFLPGRGGRFPLSPRVPDGRTARLWQLPILLCSGISPCMKGAAATI